MPKRRSGESPQSFLSSGMTAMKRPATARMPTARSARGGLCRGIPTEAGKLIWVGHESNSLNHPVRHVERQHPDWLLAGGAEDGRSVIDLNHLQLQVGPLRHAGPFAVRHLPDGEEESRHLVGADDWPPGRTYPSAAVGIEGHAGRQDR